MPPTRRSANRKQQILQEAMGLFSSRGYEGTSVRVIARACGITEAAIYRHYKSKAHLYDEVICDKARRHSIREQLDAAEVPGAVADVLDMVARHILSMAEKDPELMRLMFYNSLEMGKGAATLFREVRLPFIEFLAEELKRLVKAGEIRDVDPFITSRCFVGMVMDCALNTEVWSKVSQVDFSADSVVCNNVPIFARGLEVD